MTAPRPKVIFVMFVPMTEHFEKRFHIPELLRSGIEIELWDITDLCFRDIYFSGVIERPYIVKFKDFAAIKRRLEMSDISHAIFILILRLNFRTLKFYLLFSRNRCRMYTFVEGLIPRARSISTRFKIICHSLLDPKKITNYFLNLIPWICKRLNLVREYDTVFVSGSVAAALYEGKSKLVQVNYLDYDNYMEKRENPTRLINGNYCVFLDGNLAHDSDNKVLGLKTVTPSRYFQAMNVFFGRIEKSRGTRVVLATNPKSKYDKGSFGSRPLYHGQTHELIKNCSFVIADYSTAVAYAVLYKKPIIFYYTKEMKKLSYFTYIKGSAVALDCSLCNIDLLHDNDPIPIHPVNLKRYDDYKYNFLTSKESETRRTRDILLEYFEEIESPEMQKAVG